MQSHNDNDHMEEELAVVGMAVRVPGANSIGQFWDNVKNGIESISFFSEEELREAGIPAAHLGNPDYVKAKGVLGDAEWFDADFFGFSPRIASLTDPQHRVFLECAWEAVENAGYDTERYEGRVGVYAGQSMNTYMLYCLQNEIDLVASAEGLQVAIGNDKDSLTTEVSYKMNLRGPGVTVQTSSSTSLSAVHFACQGLLNYECDMALAGGVSIHFPEKSGYMSQEGGTTSPDGHCRAFDERAKGFVSGHGAGVVVLKRLVDAIEDRDHIHAVVKGSAVNNDGSNKVSYMAPSVDGQAQVYMMAQAVAGVDPETIDYIEAHGTGTSIGDPIEIAGLTKAFRAATDKRGFCAIGSVKTNIGHLDTAAGVVGMIKAVLAVSNKAIPPSLHYQQANPHIDFAASPFYVNAQLAEWERKGSPRRAGVSSFGMGGTNAHVIIEEAPERAAGGASRERQVLPLSAKSEGALAEMGGRMAAYGRTGGAADLADVAYTLQTGRRRFEHRKVVVCDSCEGLAEALDAADPERVFAGRDTAEGRPVAFMFPGQGSQYINMASGLYADEPAFREALDRCADLAAPHLGRDLRRVIYDQGGNGAADRLRQTALAQPALFAVEYALASLWAEWGVRPAHMIGHSIGEYVAACLAGVFSLPDALQLVCARGRLMQGVDRGAMLSVPLGRDETLALAGERLDLAAVNGPELCVVSGEIPAIEGLHERLQKRGVAARRLHTSHAFHSRMMDPILRPFEAQVAQVALNAPQVPYVSNVTGKPVEASAVTDAAYWVEHLRRAVDFSGGMETVLAEPDYALLEVGPGNVLGSLAKQHLQKPGGRVVLSSLGHVKEQVADGSAAMKALAKLWIAGVDIDWDGLHRREPRNRVALPTYPFQRQRCWIEPRQGGGPGGRAPDPAAKDPDIGAWFYRPVWRQEPLGPPDPAAKASPPRTLVLADAAGIGRRLADACAEAGGEVVVARPGRRFLSKDDGSYELNPESPDDYEQLLRELPAGAGAPTRIVHLWSIGRGAGEANGAPGAAVRGRGLYSLLYLAKALAAGAAEGAVELYYVSDGMCGIETADRVRPEKAMAASVAPVISQECGISCRCVDVPPQDAAGACDDRVVAALVEEMAAAGEPLVAYRGGTRWVRDFARVFAGEGGGRGTSLKRGGSYLITGGLGHIGFELARYLAGEVGARLVLVGRSAPSLAGGQEGGAAAEARSRVRELEALGAEVVVARADVADEGDMRRAVESARRAFGGLNGVFHLAGEIGDGLFKAIGLSDEADWAKNFAAKVRGVAVLHQAVQGEQLDFCCLFSSLSSLLGGVGYAGYAAANGFMDAFAAERNRVYAEPWVSVNWDAWNLGGQFAAAGDMGRDLAGLAIDEKDAPEAFRRLFASGAFGQIAVSTADLGARRDKWIRDAGAREAAADGGEGAAGLHPRPDLGSEYAEATSETQKVIADIWQELFGIEKIGIHDDFFELGGHSLLAVQFLNRLQQAVGRDVQLQSLFEQTTVAKLAALIDGDQEGAGGGAGGTATLAERIAAGDPRGNVALVVEYARQSIARSGGVDLAAVGGAGPVEPSLLAAAETGLIQDLKRDLGLSLYPHELAGKSRIEEIGAYLADELARQAQLAEGGKPPGPTVPAVSCLAYEVDEFAPPSPGEKNESMVFLHSSPRSGSTLLRVMMGGHPALFCPPELYLLASQTMRGWRESLIHPGLAQGLHRAFMELEGLTAVQGEEYVERLVADDVPASEVYRKLQDLAAPRTLVDKTPIYSLDSSVLGRGEQIFAGTKYVHLVRHPYSVIDSLVKNRMHKLFAPGDVDPYELAELIWVRTNDNLARFTAGLPGQRHYLLRYEDLVRDPEGVAGGLCEFLDIPFAEDMLHPYRGGRMMDGVGDPNIHRHSTIDPALGDAWRQARLPSALSADARELADRFGYELPGGRVVVSAGKAKAAALSYAQERLWFVHRLDSESAAYNIRAVVELRGEVNRNALVQSVYAIARRHEILHTTFPAVDGIPAPALAPGLKPEVRTVDLGHIPRDRREGAALEYAAAACRIPFDLAEGPLLRLWLFPIEEGVQLLALSMHHITSDGWSSGILVKELAAHYGAFVLGQPQPLPELSVQYGDYSRLQRDQLRGEFLESLEGYWRERFADPPPELELPVDFERPEVETLRGASLKLAVPPAAYGKLKEAGCGPGITPFMTVLSAFQVVLHCCAGQEDLVVGTDIAGRDGKEFEDLIGCMVNQVPLRTSLAGDPSFKEVVERVRESAVGAYAHKDLPFQKLVDALGVERELGRHPLFQTMFVFLNTPMPEFAAPGLTLRMVDVEKDTVHFDLTLIAREDSGSLSCSFDYSTELFAEATVRRLADSFLRVIRLAGEDPEIRLGELASAVAGWAKAADRSVRREAKAINRMKLKEVSRRKGAAPATGS